MLNYFYTIYILTKWSENFNLFRGIIANKYYIFLLITLFIESLEFKC